jgi:hypothetical protein
MRALLIQPDIRSIETIDLDSHADIARLVGYDTLESDAVGTAADRLYFDEECFLRGSGGRFQIDRIIPVSGHAVIVGTADDGVILRDVATDIDDVRSRIQYL